MSISDEWNQVMPRIPGSTLVPSGTYVCPNTLATTGTIAFTQTTTDNTLPAIDWWHMIPTSTVNGSATTATVASGLNTTLNATALSNSISPIASTYAYVSSNLAVWVSGDAPESKGLGAQSS
jgi:hypothetical protein